MRVIPPVDGNRFYDVAIGVKNRRPIIVRMIMWTYSRAPAIASSGCHRCCMECVYSRPVRIREGDMDTGPGSASDRGDCLSDIGSAPRRSPKAGSVRPSPVFRSGQANGRDDPKRRSEQL